MEDNYRKWLSLLPKATAAVIAISLVITVAYEAVFYWSLGISIREVPNSINDYFRGTLNWAPYVIFILLLSMWIGNKMLGFNILPNKDETFGGGNKLYKVFEPTLLLSMGIIVVLNMLFGEILIPKLAAAYSLQIVIMVSLITFITSRDNISALAKESIKIFIIIVFIVIYQGYSEGLRALDFNQRFDKIRLKRKPDVLVDAKKLRQYEKAFFVKYKYNNEFAFISSDELIEYIKQIEETSSYGIIGTIIQNKLSR